MKKIEPWYSANENIYHEHLDCKAGSEIDSAFVRKGTGDRSLCPECNNLIENSYPNPINDYLGPNLSAEDDLITS